jgi:hypothetical protein
MTDRNAGPRALVGALLAGDATTATALLPTDVAFHSPVADYRGREAVTTVLRALTAVLGDARRTAALLEQPGETVAFFAATVADRPAEGMLRVIAAPDGMPADVTLMVRPLGALMAGVERMKALLAIS